MLEVCEFRDILLTTVFLKDELHEAPGFEEGGGKLMARLMRLAAPLMRRLKREEDLEPLSTSSTSTTATRGMACASDQRISNVLKSTWTKHLVRGNTPSMINSATLPFATGSIEISRFVAAPCPRPDAARYLYTAAAEDGAKCGVCKPSARTTRPLKS
eukprot:7390977-Prymnesium_polylepis.1